VRDLPQAEGTRAAGIVDRRARLHHERQLHAFETTRRGPVNRA
jgi:hypothetical protein